MNDPKYNPMVDDLDSICVEDSRPGTADEAPELFDDTPGTSDSEAGGNWRERHNLLTGNTNKATSRTRPNSTIFLYNSGRTNILRLDVPRSSTF